MSGRGDVEGEGIYTFFVNQADQKLARICALNKGIENQKRYKFTPPPGCPDEAVS